MSYGGGADSWAGYGGVSSVGGRHGNHRRNHRRDRGYPSHQARDDRGDYDDRRGEHQSDLHSNHGSDYRSDHRSNASDDHRGDHRGHHRGGGRNRHRNDHGDDHRGYRGERFEREEHDRHNRRYSETEEGGKGREKGHGKGSRPCSVCKGLYKLSELSNGTCPTCVTEAWNDRHQSSTSSQVATYTGLPSPLSSQTPIPQEHSMSRAEALRRTETVTSHGSVDSNLNRFTSRENVATQGPYDTSTSVLSTPSISIAPAVRQDPGNELILQATKSLQENDISGVNRVLMRLAKVENLHSARQDPKWKEILERIDALLAAPQSSFVQPKDLADLAFALGKLQLQDPVVNDLLHRIAEIAKFHVERFKAHDMSGMVWGFASLGVRNESLMSVTAAEVVNKIVDFDQRQLSNTAWAFAKCGLWNEQLVNAIATECLNKINSFTAQSLSHISWAMAQWGTRREDLMDAISMEAQRKISDFAPPSLAMTAWSFASLQLKSIHLMTAISKEAIAKIVHFKTQDLAHLAWAFANLRIQDVDLFGIMADEIQKNIKGTLPPELSNIAWAFSKNGLPNEALMTVIANEAIQQIRAFKPAEIAMLTWAFAVAGLQNKELMTEIGAQVGKKIERYSAPQLSHIAWAFGALSLRHSEFLSALSNYVRQNMEAFKAQGLSNIAWALAMVAFRDEDLLRRIAPEIARDVAELRPLALARCAWAYRVLMVQSPHLMVAIAAEAAKKVADFPTKALAKLVDAVYLVPQAGDAIELEKALNTRTSEVVDHIVSAVGSRARLDEQQYSQGLVQLGLLDAGVVGTPLILKRLEIDMPSLEFVDKCISQAEQCKSAVGHPELAVAQVDLTWHTGDEYKDIEWRWDDFIVRHNAPGGGYDTSGQVQRKVVNRSTFDVEALDTMPVPQYEESAEQGLIAVDLGGRSGKSEVLFLVLTSIHNRLHHRHNYVQAECDDVVRGTVQIFSSTIPSLSAIGALRQFCVLYEGITVELAEQIGAIED